MTPTKEVILRIRCSADTKIGFKVLAAKLDKNYEETLLLLLEREKEHPLQKKEIGVVRRL